MQLRRWFVVPFVLVPLFGCGGGQEEPASTTSTSTAGQGSTQAQPSGNQAGPADPTQAGGAASPAGTAAAQASKAALPLVELKVAEPPASPNPMPQATITAPTANQSVPADKVNDFEVKLQVKDWPVAKEGPHVHLILDNKPYHAVYDPKASVKLSELSGGEAIGEGQHVLVAFPSRETHISVKPDAGKKPYSVVTFWVGKAGKAGWKPADPTLVYSRPKASYEGAKADKIALDFYLLNAELGDGKYSVKATVTPSAGDPQTLMITKWVPVDITNLPDGEARVKLELLDKDGKSVPGAMNQTERVITVKHEKK